MQHFKGWLATIFPRFNVSSEIVSYTTGSLDKAALLLTLQAELVTIGSTYPDNTFTFQVERRILEYAKGSPRVDYHEFVANRRELKAQTRLKAGLPEHFTGYNKGFTFADLAQVK